MIYKIMVGVALSRPPKTDEFRKVVVEADSKFEALLLAAQISSCTCTMPVSTKIIEDNHE